MPSHGNYALTKKSILCTYDEMQSPHVRCHSALLHNYTGAVELNAQGCAYAHPIFMLIINKTTGLPNDFFFFFSSCPSRPPKREHSTPPLSQKKKKKKGGKIQPTEPSQNRQPLRNTTSDEPIRNKIIHVMYHSLIGRKVL